MNEAEFLQKLKARSRTVKWKERGVFLRARDARHRHYCPIDVVAGHWGAWSREIIGAENAPLKLGKRLARLIISAADGMTDDEPTKRMRKKLLRAIGRAE